MAGFATKLRLISEKFFQPSDGSLELSGSTKIAESGDFRYNTHPNFTGDTQIIDKKYVDDITNEIANDANSGITASTTYSLSTPSTVDVGGLDAGSELTGFTSNELLEKILVATLYPTLTPPSNSFGVYDDDTHDTSVNGSEYEVGRNVTLYFRATFDRGEIDPQYDASSQYRSGPANSYNYTGDDLPSSESSSSSEDTQQIDDYTIQQGDNEWTNTVSYDDGVQPYDSKGNEYDSPLSSDITDSKSVKVIGYYPYFYGTSSTEPTINQALVDGGTKEIKNSDGTITIDYGSDTGNVYHWFAIPDTSTTKEGWYISDLNKGNIGTEEDLFGPEEIEGIESPDGYWSTTDYKFYVTTYKTDFEGKEIQLRNDPQQ